jgi:hypothetical protein
MLMGMDRKKGRKVLSGRAEDAMKKIRSCLARRKMKAPKGLKNVARQVSDIAEIRNRVGHGIWMNHSDTGQLMLQRITGVWEVNGKVVDTKRHTPEGQKVTTQWLAEQVDKIHKCIEDTAALSAEVNAALS